MAIDQVVLTLGVCAEDSLRGWGDLAVDLRRGELGLDTPSERLDPLVLQPAVHKHLVLKQSTPTTRDITN